MPVFRQLEPSGKSAGFVGFTIVAAILVLVGTLVYRGDLTRPHALNKVYVPAASAS